MPPEQYIDPSHYLLERTDSFMRDYVDTRFVALEKALTLAEHATELRLEGMNEWRGQSKDQMSTYATRIELDTLRDIISQGRIDRLQREKSFVTKAELSAAQDGRKDWLALVISGILLLINVVGFLAK